MISNNKLLHKGRRSISEQEDRAMLALPSDIRQIAEEMPYSKMHLTSVLETYSKRRRLGYTHEEAREKLRARIQKANAEAARMTYGPDHPATDCLELTELFNL